LIGAQEIHHRIPGKENGSVHLPHVEKSQRAFSVKDVLGYHSGGKDRLALPSRYASRKKRFFENNLLHA
jgi:methyl coenzyme M reductase gamma subunit